MKFTAALLTGLALAFPSVLAQGTTQVTDPFAVVDALKLEAFIKNATTLEVSSFTGNLVNTAWVDWGSLNWVIRRRDATGAIHDAALLRVPSRQWNVTYPAQGTEPQIEFVLDAFELGMLIVPANYNPAQVAWRGIATEANTSSGEKRAISFMPKST